MNKKEKNPAGMILRAERIRQGKGQKEVCYGICVVSYLSKIERGSAEPDMAILKQLLQDLKSIMRQILRFLLRAGNRWMNFLQSAIWAGK